MAPSFAGFKPFGEWKEQIAAMPIVEDIIEGIVSPAPSYALIVGSPGIGKTMLALQIGLCIAVGIPFLGFKCRQSKVGYIGFESSRQKLLGRLEKMIAQFDNFQDNFFCDVVKPFRLLVQPQQFIAFAKGLDVLILDPMRYLVAGDYTKPEYASPFVSMLQELSTETQCAVILVHHEKKPGLGVFQEPDDLYRVKGATDYVDSANSVLLFTKAKRVRDDTGRFVKNSEDRILYFPKTKDAYEDISPKHLRFNRETLLFEKVE